ncbi:MAG: ABC transporter substrate-binding protein [Alphaproteobacteria bacterium]|nr:ABC transporter substrate-binding protein [Alphaproteobacteria bacterium]
MRQTRNMGRFVCCAGLAGVLAISMLTSTLAQAAETLRVGVLKFGTVNWVLDTVRHHKLDQAEGFALEVLPLASKSATSVALQAGEADVIVTDWIWAHRQRAAGADYQFAPYSTALGAVVVPADSEIKSIADLGGKRLGVAGGALDKSWLLLRALSQKDGGADLGGEVEPVYGAPPLLSQELQAGRIDAVLTFWPYAARLEAAGFRALITVQQIVERLGVTGQPAMVGYVVSRKLADSKGGAVDGFLRAVRAANKILEDSPAEWNRLRPLMKAQDDREFLALRDTFRRGIPKSWGAVERTDAARLYDTLANLGGAKLVGSATAFDPDVFWPDLDF